uniref:Uncharacterized protein n=1 Tax=Timema tahoe TaxID=61484 RepID=A0A7R9FJ79_9NEOP|nr:unnamed protein product [Timema tahoe]
MFTTVLTGYQPLGIVALNAQKERIRFVSLFHLTIGRLGVGIRIMFLVICLKDLIVSTGSQACRPKHSPDIVGPLASRKESILFVV